METTGGGLPVRVQKLAVGNPAGSPTLRRSLLRRPLQRREFAAAGSPAFLTFSPGFLFSCRLFPHWSTASHPWAARFSQGIRNPCARFDIRLPHPPSSLWGRPSFFKNTNPPAGQIGSICPAGGFFICCIIRTDRQTSCLRHRPAEWERKWAASWGAARWFPHR